MVVIVAMTIKQLKIQSVYSFVTKPCRAVTSTKTPELCDLQL